MGQGNAIGLCFSTRAGLHRFSRRVHASNPPFLVGSRSRGFTSCLLLPACVAASQLRRVWQHRCHGDCHRSRGLRGDPVSFVILHLLIQHLIFAAILHDHNLCSAAAVSLMRLFWVVLAMHTVNMPLRIRPTFKCLHTLQQFRSAPAAVCVTYCECSIQQARVLQLGVPAYFKEFMLIASGTGKALLYLIARAACSGDTTQLEFHLTGVSTRCELKSSSVQGRH